MSRTRSSGGARSGREAQPLTHVATGQGKVDKVASNRRVSRDENGNIKAMRQRLQRRGADCAAGRVDRPVAEDSRVLQRRPEDCRLSLLRDTPHELLRRRPGQQRLRRPARKRRQAEEPGCLHVYFTGCAGNVAAGKYNDGSKETRPLLTERVYEGIVASEQNLKPEPLGKLTWRTIELLPVARASFDAAKIEQEIANKQGAVVSRNRPAYTLSWIRRWRRNSRSF